MASPLPGQIHSDWSSFLPFGILILLYQRCLPQKFGNPRQVVEMFGLQSTQLQENLQLFRLFVLRTLASKWSLLTCKIKVPLNFCIFAPAERKCPESSSPDPSQQLSRYVYSPRTSQWPSSPGRSRKTPHDSTQFSPACPASGLASRRRDKGSRSD